MSQGNWDETNRGVLFKNKEKKSDSHPDYTGKINVAEDDYRLAAWIKTSKSGEKFMSLSVTPAQPAAKPAPKPEPSKSGVDFDDDPPF